MNSFHTYAFPNAKSIIVCGDIHGEFNAVIYKLCIQYHAGRTRAALPVQFFPVFSTEHLWGRRYFRNTKKTARTRHTKAARWFQ